MDHQIYNILSTGSMYDELIGKAYLHKIRIEEISFIQTEACLNPGRVQFIHTLSLEKRTVIFTSKQAVRAVCAALNNNIPNWEVYCINGATQKEIIKRWPQCRIAGTAVNGAALATRITDSYTNEREIVFFCGDQRLNEIPDRLAAARIPLKEIMVYLTTATPQPIAKEYDGIFFFSPSAVHSFFSVNHSGKAVLFSIGETTTSVLKKYTDDTHIIITASQPDKKEMVDLAIEYFEQINK